jgi:hypothetical protein
MKKKILIIMIVMALPFAVLAQGNNGGKPPQPAQRANMVVTNLAGKMTLTKIQQDSLKKIYTDFFTKADNYRSEGNRDMVMKSRDAMDARVKKNLSPAQYKDYTKIVEEERQKRQQEGQKPR